MEQPEIGTIWVGQGYTIEVIDKNDKRNINSDGTYKRTGQVIYKYIDGANNKIGNCKTLKGFYDCWNEF